MGLEQVYRCDKCRLFIDSIHLRGYVIRGNICVADNPDCGGLVGNNIDKEGKVYRESCYCEPCLKEILNYKIGSEHAPPPPKGPVHRKIREGVEIVRQPHTKIKM